MKYQNPRHSEKIQTFRNLEEKKKTDGRKGQEGRRKGGQVNKTSHIQFLDFSQTPEA